MSSKDIYLNYPSRHDLTQTLSEFCRRTFVDEFSASNGVFITKANQHDLAEEISGFFYERKDLERIRMTAFKSSASSSLSGFTLSSLNTEFNLVSTLVELRSSQKLPEGVKLGPLVKINNDEEETTKVDEEEEDKEVIYKGTVEYVNKKPGKMQFLEEEVRNYEYAVRLLEDKTFQVLVESYKSTDAGHLEKLIKKQVGKDLALETLDGNLLSSKNTILFFDRLSTEGMNDEWRFSEIKKLRFKKGKLEDEDSEEIDPAVLSGISQAILEGTNLRENEFVKKAEASGYRFTEAGFEYESKLHPFVINIGAEFKSRPKVFEVSVLNYEERQGVEEQRVKSDLEDAKEVEIKTYFWQKAREIYKSLKSS